MNWLTIKINDHLSKDFSILDLCCGNGMVSDGFLFKTYTGVDIVQPYLDMSTLKDNANAKLICSDVLKFCEYTTAKYDVVMAIDAVEHFVEDEAIKLINYMEQISTKKVIIFTPENTIDAPTCNDMKDAWGITEGDKYQQHLSMFKRKFFSDRKYEVFQLSRNPNCYTNIPYYEMLYVLTK